MVKKLLLITFLFFYTAIFSQKTLQKLSAAPNPFYTTTTITFKSIKKQPVFFIVKNVLGKTVYKKIITSKKGLNSIPFHRNDLQSGMYIYSIQSRKEVISKRFVVK